MKNWCSTEAETGNGEHNCRESRFVSLVIIKGCPCMRATQRKADMNP